MRTISIVLFFLLSFPASANTLIIGVLGGWAHPEAAARGVRKLALRIRGRNLPGVAVETFANHNLAPALATIKEWWAKSKHDHPTLVIYGQSFGGSAVMKLAQDLKPLGIPIALTVQIDSVGMHRLVPTNVAAAANFYQREAWAVKGSAQIRAEDPKVTEIVGNYEYHYRDKQIDESNESWARRLVFGTHLKMEDDPALWSKVEQLIVERVH